MSKTKEISFLHALLTERLSGMHYLYRENIAAVNRAAASGDLDTLRVFEQLLRGKSQAKEIEPVIRLLRAGGVKEVASILTERHLEAQQATVAALSECAANGWFIRSNLIDRLVQLSFTTEDPRTVATIISERHIFDEETIAGLLESSQGIAAAVRDGVL